MRLSAHFLKWEIAYRLICAFLANAFLLGYFWGTHAVWELGPCATFGLGAVAPKKALPVFRGIFVLSLLPTIATLIYRVSYLWSVPYPQTGDIVFEGIYTFAMTWVLVATAWLLFVQRPQKSISSNSSLKRDALRRAP